MLDVSGNLWLSCWQSRSSSCWSYSTVCYCLKLCSVRAVAPAVYVSRPVSSFLSHLRCMSCKESVGGRYTTNSFKVNISKTFLYFSNVLVGRWICYWAISSTLICRESNILSLGLYLRNDPYLFCSLKLLGEISKLFTEVTQRRM